MDALQVVSRAQIDGINLPALSRILGVWVDLGCHIGATHCTAMLLEIEDQVS
jgi:hypothetical protein